MTIPRRYRAALTTAALAAAVTVLAPTATAAPQPAPTPISHLSLNLGATQSQVNFNWFTDSGNAESVQIAPLAAQEGTEFPAAAAHSFPATLTSDNDRGLTTAAATATGLSANTEYIYRVGSEEGGWSPMHSYSTENFGSEFNFTVYGDAQLGSGASTGLGDGGDLASDAAGWYQTLEAANTQYPDASFQFSLGDQIDGYGDGGALEEFLGDRDPQYDAFLAPAADELREVPLAVLSGNHDDAGATYDQYFNMPNETDRNYWSLQNNTLMIGLDTNVISIGDYAEIAQLETEEERQAWLDGKRGDIEARYNELTDYVDDVIAQHGDQADWVVVGFHQSPYSQASHHFDPDLEIMRQILPAAFSEAGVDLVLGGHDHIYTRTHLMDGTTPVVPEEAPEAGDVLVQEDNEVMFMTASSSSGSKFYDYMDSEGGEDPALTHPSTALWNQDYTPDFSNVQVTEDRLTVTTHNSEDGTVVDKFTLVDDDSAGAGSAAGSAATSSSWLGSSSGSSR